MATKSDVYSCFAVPRIGALTGTIDAVALNYNGTQYFSHVALSLPSPYVAPTVLATQMTTDLSGGAHTVTVTYSKSTLLYTLSGSGNFALTSISTTLNQALGYPTFGGTIGGATSGHSSYVSSVRPFYVHLPVLQAQSHVAPKHDRKGRTQTAVSANGTPYGFSDAGVAKLRGWVHAIEARAAPAAIATRGTPLDQEDETTLIPWSWERWRSHVLGHEVFALYDPSGTAADFYILNEDSTAHEPGRAWEDFDGTFTVPVATAFWLGAQS